MKQLIYTSKLLADLGACDAEIEWAAKNLTEGTPITREILESVPEPLWVWRLACRLDADNELVWVAVNAAFREAAKLNPTLLEWVGKVSADNWKAAAKAAKAAKAVAEEVGAWAAALAAEAAAWAALAALAAEAARAWAWAWAAEAAAGRAARGDRIGKELAATAVQWLMDNGFAVVTK